MRSVFSIARNTFTETIRQSQFGVILASAALLIILSPSFATFTFMVSGKLVQDMGLSTIMLAGMFLAVFSSTTVISREIEGRTALTVLSKPVSREAFVIGKFLGIAAGITLATYILSIILVLIFRFGVKDTAATRLDWTIMLGIFLALVSSCAIGIYQNFFLNKPFMTTAVITFSVTITACFVFFLFFDKNLSLSGFGTDIDWQVALAALLSLMVVLILVSVSVASSTRGNVVSSLVACGIFFLGGMLSPFAFGQHAANNVFASIAYKIFPNFQIFWVTEAMAANTKIPLDYVGSCMGYTLLYIIAVLGVALFLFSRREVRD